LERHATEPCVIVCLHSGHNMCNSQCATHWAIHLVWKTCEHSRKCRSSTSSIVFCFFHGKCIISRKLQRENKRQDKFREAILFFLTHQTYAAYFVSAGFVHDINDCFGLVWRRNYFLSCDVRHWWKSLERRNVLIVPRVVIWCVWQYICSEVSWGNVNIIFGRGVRHIQRWCINCSSRSCLFANIFNTDEGQHPQQINSH